MSKLKQAFNKKSETVYGVEKPEIDINIHAENEKDKQNIIGLVNKLCKSEHGKKALEFAKENDVTFFTTKDNSMGGCYIYDQNCVLINSNFSKSYQLATLAHELRHAYQFRDGRPYFSAPYSDVKSYTMGTRALEADAVAFEHVCMWEIGQATNKRIWGNIKKDYPKVSSAVEKAAGKDGKLDIYKAMENGFKGWFKDPYLRNFYEKEHMDYNKSYVEKGKEYYDNDELYQEKVSGQTIVENVCAIDDFYYIDPDSTLLEKKQYLGVTKKFKDYFEKFSEQRAKDTGIIDMSIKEVPLRHAQKKKTQPIIAKALASKGR
jgi:hypothetical protein